MPDDVQQNFIRSVVTYLKKQVDGHTLTPDAQESVEVAIQCLQAAFDVGEDSEEQPSQAAETTVATAEGSTASGSGHAEIDIFQMFQTVYVEQSPDLLQKAEAIKNEGNRLMKEGKYNEALLQYNRAITYNPKNPIFYCNRAATHIRLGDNDHAVTDCKSALAYNPTYGKAYGRLGIAYSNLGKYEEAQQAYSKAIEIEPDNQDYRNNLEVVRNSRTQGVHNLPHQLTEGLNAMLANPAIRNLFSSAEIDLEQVQSMSQNPMVLNVIGQMFNGFQGGGSGGMGGGNGPLPNDMLQLFQSFATQLANSSQIGNQSGNGNGDPGSSNQSSDGNQPPPPAN